MIVIIMGGGTYKIINEKRIFTLVINKKIIGAFKNYEENVYGLNVNLLINFTKYMFHILGQVGCILFRL
jgi:hypothetical protein